MLKNMHIAPTSKNLTWLFLLGLIFVVCNIILVINGFYWLSLLPLALVIALLWLFALDKLLLLSVFLTPLSIPMDQMDFGTSLSLPAEPLMFGILLIFLVRQLYSGDYDRRIIKHPISILIFIHLIWLGITTITSEMPLVSAKFLIARLWFVVPFFFLAVQMFRQYDNIKRFLWMYIIPLTLVIFYTTFRLWQSGFDEKLSQSVMTPFYPSHTSYGAVLAMFIPLLCGTIFIKNQIFSNKLTGITLLLIFVFAILFSYSRAVWVSLPAALGVFIFIYFRIKLRTIIGAVIVFGVLLFTYQNDIIIALEKNKQDSSGEFSENLESISNITTDDSNTERLNRWSSAISMFRERPVFGWGPGTYQFQYAPFQKAKNLTLISTNAGNLGNAHSEYIGPLAETGLIGSLSIILIVLYVVWMGIRLSIHAANQEARWLALMIILGLITYLVHGFLNNYLDSDKASVPFWGFIAILTGIDLYHNRTEIREEKL